MPRYADTVVTSKLGVNFVKTAVDAAGCIFHRIDQENDLGIDAIIELIKDGVPLNKQFAVQIKSGPSFHNSPSNQCLIPVGNHFSYWLNYPLPVYGIVYIPSLNTANWVNIKNYLKGAGQCSTIRFDRTKANVFDSQNFGRVFLPGILNKTPKLSFGEAKSLLQSAHASETYLGLVVLFGTAPNILETWDLFVDFFRTREPPEIPLRLIYYLAHIPWHPDIWYHGETINADTEAHVRKRFDEFDRYDIAKLLSFIGEETGISRGSIGQSVEAIISSLSNRDRLLLEVIENADLPMPSREYAALIYAYHNRQAALPSLSHLSEQGSWYAGELHSYLKDNGWVDPIHVTHGTRRSSQSAQAGAAFASG
ncbi:MAG: DUF4365 domain-containing protein [Syntrophobacteraceae bacterium]